MATSSQITNDPGEEVSAGRIVVGVPGKSFIVGKYDEDGRRKGERPQLEDNRTVAHVKKLMVKSMSTRGGELMPGYVMTENGPIKRGFASLNLEKVAKQHAPPPIEPKKKSRKKKQATPVQQIEPVAEVAQNDNYEPVKEIKPVSSQTFPVVFVIESGTIKSMADAVIECDSAIMLVYQDKDHVSYEPNAGGKLSLQIDGKTTEVMYLGMIFEWYQTSQQLMVFLKTEA